MRKFLVILLLAMLAYYFSGILQDIDFGAPNNLVGKQYLENTVKGTGSVNTVTAVVVSYRSLDTLGEVAVLFLAATGLGMLLHDIRGKSRKKQNASIIVRSSSIIFYPLIVLLGAYVFLHGHLTPGGGFQGGAIIATGVLLMYMSYRNFNPDHRALSIIESLAGTTFVTIGIAGLIFGSSFLENFLPLGEANTLFSAGVIPIIYSAVGFKVGAELVAVLDNLLKTIR